MECVFFCDRLLEIFNLASNASNLLFYFASPSHIGTHMSFTNYCYVYTLRYSQSITFTQNFTIHIYTHTHANAIAASFVMQQYALVHYLWWDYHLFQHVLCIGVYPLPFFSLGQRIRFIPKCACALTLESRSYALVIYFALHFKVAFKIVIIIIETKNGCANQLMHIIF